MLLSKAAKFSQSPDSQTPSVIKETRFQEKPFSVPHLRRRRFNHRSLPAGNIESHHSVTRGRLVIGSKGRRRLVAEQKKKSTRAIPFRNHNRTTKY